MSCHIIAHAHACALIGDNDLDPVRLHGTKCRAIDGEFTRIIGTVQSSGFTGSVVEFLTTRRKAQMLAIDRPVDLNAP